jgi:hypothetical protein
MPAYRKILQPLFPDQTREVFKGAVVGTLRILVEATGGKLPRSEVIPQAVAADPFTAARFIGTVAQLYGLFFLAFHVQQAPPVRYFFTTVW